MSTVELGRYGLMSQRAWKTHSQGTPCPNSLGWSHWLTTSSKDSRERGCWTAFPET